MRSFDAVIRLVNGLGREELRHWITERWVRPEGGTEGYVFHEVDVARVQLIFELRHELAIDEEAMPVVLRLLDQVYGLRRRLRLLNQVIEAQPETLRQTLREQLGPLLSEDR
jgi:chaperone modulatory protein CbpM